MFRAEPNRWREVTLLAGAKSARGTPFAAWLLAEELCPKETSEDDGPDAWGALLAAQVLIENHCLSVVALRNREKVERIRRSLALIVTKGMLPPVDRAQAGDALAEIGDPRDLDELVSVPGGSFSMGSPKNDDLALTNEHPQHPVPAGPFKIGKYPVTVARWRQFTEARKYQGDPDALKGLANQPVVHVSWHDALEFCGWLTERWRDERKIGETDIVRLPTEAEWEKAARGTARFAWPWGNEFDAGKANTSGTGIGRVCAAGCFPTGASPYGAMDMAGNVWEWCQSKYRPYKYAADDGREDLSGEDSRVLRGGAFYFDERLARCAYRLDFRPDGRDDYLGFRVVVVPPDSGREFGLSRRLDALCFLREYGKRCLQSVCQIRGLRLRPPDDPFPAIQQRVEIAPEWLRFGWIAPLNPLFLPARTAMIVAISVGSPLIRAGLQATDPRLDPAFSAWEVFLAGMPRQPAHMLRICLRSAQAARRDLDTAARVFLRPPPAS